MSEQSFYESESFEPSSLANDVISEDSAAQAFVEEHGRELRFCHSSGRWYRWNGQIWKQDETHKAFHWARQLAILVNGLANAASQAVSKASPSVIPSSPSPSHTGMRTHGCSGPRTEPLTCGLVNYDQAIQRNTSPRWFRLPPMDPIARDGNSFSMRPPA
jgi:D5 N terminal like